VNTWTFCKTVYTTIWYNIEFFTINFAQLNRTLLYHAKCHQFVLQNPILDNISFHILILQFYHREIRCKDFLNDWTIKHLNYHKSLHRWLLLCHVMKQRQIHSRSDSPITPLWEFYLQVRSYQFLPNCKYCCIIRA